MIYVLLLTVGLVAISILLLGVRVFFTKKGSFPDSHVSANPELKKKGISCAKTQDLQEQNKKNIFEV